jgi:hypothetical protein
MAEEEAVHRRSMEAQIVAAGIESDRSGAREAGRGQICALVITLVALGLGAFTAYQGHEIAGSIIGVGGIGSIVTTFILGKKRQEEEPAAQQRTTDPPRDQQSKKQKRTNR